MISDQLTGGGSPMSNSRAFKRSMRWRCLAALALAACSPDAADVANAGRQDRALTGYGWRAAWQPLGGHGTSDPALVQTADGQLHAFVRGTEGHLWWSAAAGPGAGWSPWQDLGGALAGTPSAVSISNFIYVFVRGSADNGLYLRFYSSG